jgi:MFS family permease
MAVEFGSPSTEGTWLTSVYSLGGTIAFMLCGANSDLFGRRAFILLGNVLVLIGTILGGTSHSINQSIAAHAFLGFGGGNCQIAAFALPELLPNKWRHVGVVIADAGVFMNVVMGPVVLRIAFAHNAVWHIRSLEDIGVCLQVLVEMGLLGYDHNTRHLIRSPYTLWSVYKKHLL